MDHKLNMAFHIKGGPEGATPKYKAHVATQDFTRIKGSFMQPFTLTAKSRCLHTVQAPAAKSNLKTHKTDVEVAYPNEDNKLAKCVPAVPWHTSASQNARPISAPPIFNQHLIKLNSLKVDIIAHQCTLDTVMYDTLRTHPDFTHTATAIDCHAANPGTKCARHLTTCLIPVPNLWAKWTLATPAMSGYALTLRCMLPGLRGHVGNPATGDV